MSHHGAEQGQGRDDPIGAQGVLELELARFIFALVQVERTNVLVRARGQMFGDELGALLPVLLLALLL